MCVFLSQVVCSWDEDYNEVKKMFVSIDVVQKFLCQFLHIFLSSGQEWKDYPF